jgi:predicted AlkP superfamily pyrophosphatase or phosphodiesterase
MKHLRTAAAALITGLILFTSCGRRNQVEHVFFIGLDGWGAYSVEKSEMTRVKQLMEDGAWTLKKRTVLPSHSAANWASMFMGVGPEVHGFYECCSQTPDLEPRMLGKNGIFPTVFQLLRDKEPEAEIGCLYEWSGIKYLIDTVSVNHYAQVPQEKLCEAACAYIATKKPRLAAFVYDDPDHVGHKYGHDTPEYYEKLKELDAWVGAIVDAIDQAGILDKSVIILTSDHGGIDHGHGGRTMMEMETPLILYGKGVKKGHCFDDLSVMEYDIASTMAWLLDLQQPQPWFGRPLTSLFEH